MTKVLSVTSECVPFVKTGGLADVAGALPAALAPKGVDMRVLLPGYPAVLAALGATETVATVKDLFGGKANILLGDAAGMTLYVLDAPHLYDRTGNIYLAANGSDWPDNPQRFGALGQAAVLISRGAAGGWSPDIVHAHDWQGALALEYLRVDPDRPGLILTIHNIAFQGLAPVDMIGTLGLDVTRFTTDGFEFWGKISALKAGITAADRVTTVSQTYAAELMRPEFGMGLDGVIRANRDKLSGIVNGIDETVWNPATDPLIETYKSPRTKVKAKEALREELDLPEADGPLCVVVSRLTQQKGLDLLLQALPGLLARGGQLALLGTGEPALEAAFRAAAANENVSVTIGYDEALAHRLIAGGDMILVPSRFEPCGLTQLYGLRYGTIPLVALTGGLADTVINASPAALGAGCATGVQFHPITTDALAAALNRACDLYAQPEVWAKMQRNAMKQQVGWDNAAASYVQLYDELADRRG